MTKSRKPGEIFNQARAAITRRDWTEAIDLLEQIVLTSPDYPGVQEMLREAHKRRVAHSEYLIGLTYFNRKEWTRAVERFEAVVHDDPDHGDAQANLEEARRRTKIDRLLGKADEHQRKSEWEQVVKALKSAWALDIGSEEIKRQLDDAEVECLYHAGERYLREKRWRAALESFERLEQRRPNYEDVSLKLEEIKKQLEEASPIERAIEFLRDPLWQGIGTIVGIIALALMLCPLVQRISPNPVMLVPTATPSLAATATASPVASPTHTATIMPTVPPSHTPTRTPTKIPSPTSPTSSPIPSPTPTTSTPTATPRPANTPTPSCSIGLVEPEDGARFIKGQEIRFHWTGSEPEEGGYYEVRVDGQSIGAAWPNPSLQKWEQTWEAKEGGHTWQVVLMAPDHHTTRWLGPIWSLNVRGGGSGAQPLPTLTTPPLPTPPTPQS